MARAKRNAVEDAESKSSATKLSDEEYAALAPSDKAHYDIKGRLGDGLDPEDTEATKKAREVAFGSGADTHVDEDQTPPPTPKSATTGDPDQNKEGSKTTVDPKKAGKDARK